MSKEKNKQPLRVKLWISYILIFTIPLFIFATVGYIWLSDNIANSVTGYYSTILEEIVDTTDRSIQQLDSLSNQLSRTAWVAKLVNMQGTTLDVDRVTPYDLFEYNQNIYASMTSIDGVNVFGIYFPSKNLVISSTGNGTLEFLFKDALNIDSFDVDDFNGVIRKLRPDTNELLIFDNISVYGKQDGGVLYLRAVQPPNSYLQPGVIYAYIPKSNIVNNMHSVISSDEFLSMQIIDTNNTFIEISTHQNDKNIEIYALSSKTGWVYQLHISKRAVLKDVAVMRNILLLVVFILLVICMGLTAVFSQKIYNPIKELLALTNRNEVVINDEFYQINKSIIELINEQGELRSRIDELKPAWISSSIIKMLGGDTPDDTQSIFEEIALQSKRNYFNTCILIRKLPNGLHVSPHPIPKINQILNKIPGNFHVYTVELIEQTVILVNYDEMQDFTSWLVQLLDLCPEVVAVIGEQVADLSMIDKSYEKASIASKYRKVHTGFRILRWDEHSTMIEGYYLPIEMEMQIVVFLQTANIERVSSLIQEIYQQNLQDSKSRKVYWDDLMENIFRLLKSVAEDAKIKIELTSEALSIQYLQQLAENICRAIYSESKGRNLILENIVEYINASIENKDLSLQYVAQKFNVSTSFVSKAFKEKTGINFNNYINQRRLEVAKELLIQGNDVTTIAHLVGYTNDVTFRRQFKISTGMTPTAYRDTMTNNT